MYDIRLVETKAKSYEGPCSSSVDSDLSGAHCPGSSKHCRGDLTGQGLPSIGKRPRSMVRNMRSAKWSGISLLLMASQDRIAGDLMFLSRQLICTSLWNAGERPQNKLCLLRTSNPARQFPLSPCCLRKKGSSWLIKLKIQVQGAQWLVFQGEMQLELENPGQVSPREFKFRAFSLTEWL